MVEVSHKADVEGLPSPLVALSPPIPVSDPVVVLLDPLVVMKVKHKHGMLSIDFDSKLEEGGAVA